MCLRLRLLDISRVLIHIRRPKIVTMAKCQALQCAMECFLHHYLLSILLSPACFQCHYLPISCSTLVFFLFACIFMPKLLHKYSVSAGKFFKKETVTFVVFGNSLKKKKRQRGKKYFTNCRRHNFQMIETQNLEHNSK